MTHIEPVKGDYYSRRSKCKLYIKETLKDLQKAEKQIAKSLLYEQAEHRFRVGRVVVDEAVKEFGDPFVINEKE